MAQTQVIRQRDFSGGEIVEHAKRRDDEAVVRSGTRSMQNCRVLPSGAMDQRPGRRLLFAHEGRVDKVRINATSVYYLCFGSDGSLTIRDSAGTIVDTQAGYDWDEDTFDLIVWDVFNLDVVICFAGQAIKVATFDGTSAWTFADYAEAVTSGGQKRTPFYRISPKGITLLPGARTGSGVSLDFSDDVLTADHVGTRIRFVERQILITAVTNATTGAGTIEETLPGSQELTFGIDPTDTYNIGDVVTGTETNSQGVVASINPSDKKIIVQLTTTSTTSAAGGGPHQHGYSSGSVLAFTTADTVVGPAGSLVPSAAAAVDDPVAVTIWDDEVMNDMRGFPRSVTVDQNRLIFCDFPAVPNGIAWSSLGDSTDLYVGALATDAFFELSPRKSRVFHVKGGADEFVFTSGGIYYIPISENNPLKPGSVTFRQIPGQSSSRLRPISTGQGLVYANYGLNRVLALVGTGQAAQPWVVRSASDLHSHLFTEIVCMELDPGNGNPPEEMLHVVNADGTCAVGRYQPGKEWVGWTPWTGIGAVRWVSALEDAVVASVEYDFGWLAEQYDADYYVDGAIAYSGVAALANADDVAVMDGVQFIGYRDIDGGGAVVTEEGDAFTDEIFGFGFDIEVEPFMPHMQGGQSFQQTMRKRAVRRGAVAVQNSTGFRVEVYRPNTGLWEVVKDRSAYDSGDNNDIAPPLREEAVEFTKIGSEHDPRARVVKDYPGPLRTLEISFEVEA